MVQAIATTKHESPDISRNTAEILRGRTEHSVHDGAEIVNSSSSIQMLLCGQRSGAMKLHIRKSWLLPILFSSLVVIAITDVVSATNVAILYGAYPLIAACAIARRWLWPLVTVICILVLAAFVLKLKLGTGVHNVGSGERLLNRLFIIAALVAGTALNRRSSLRPVEPTSRDGWRSLEDSRLSDGDEFHELIHLAGMLRVLTVALLGTITIAGLDLILPPFVNPSIYSFPLIFAVSAGSRPLAWAFAAVVLSLALLGYATDNIATIPSPRQALINRFLVVGVLSTLGVGLTSLTRFRCAR